MCSVDLFELNSDKIRQSLLKYFKYFYRHWRIFSENWTFLRYFFDFFLTINDCWSFTFQMFELLVILSPFFNIFFLKMRSAVKWLQKRRQNSSRHVDKTDTRGSVRKVFPPRKCSDTKKRDERKRNFIFGNDRDFSLLVADWSRYWNVSCFFIHREFEEDCLCLVSLGRQRLNGWRFSVCFSSLHW